MFKGQIYPIIHVKSMLNLILRTHKWLENVKFLMRRYYKKPVSFLDFQSPNRSDGGMHGGSHWIARALLDICDVLVEQWLNLHSLNSSLGASRDKRDSLGMTAWQPPCILRGNGVTVVTENPEKRRAYFSPFSSKIWHSRVICVFLRWGLT